MTTARTLAALAALYLPTSGQTPASIEDTEQPALDGITFADRPSIIYAPAREIADALRWTVQWNGTIGQLTLNNAIIASERIERLVDGTSLIALRDLEPAGVQIEWNSSDQAATARVLDTSVRIKAGPKRVEILCGRQELRAWQGGRMVMRSHVSTGRAGWSTPAGAFAAGPLKLKMHYSTRFDNAPMPWSVQVTGNIFIHGFTSVPTYPASHGCIRLPLTGGNPAHWFYRWVEIGTPISIRKDGHEI